MDINTFTEMQREAVIALWKKCGLVVPHNDPHKDINRKVANSPELFFVGTVNGDVVATAMAGYEGHRGWINYLAVDPPYQKQKFGTKLIEYVEEKLLGLGCPKINLQVRSTNAAVISFYESLGFTNDNVLSLGKRLISDE